MASGKVRYHYIDFLKGLACAMMLVGHGFRIRMGAPILPEKIMLYAMDFSGPLFFFLSGMNVMTFVEGSAKKKNFQSTTFYLLAAAALFFFGFTYNVNRQSIYNLDILQCVALCTAFVFLMMRTKIPMWGHLLILAFLFLIYEQFRFRLEWNQIIPQFTDMRDAIALDATIRDPQVLKLMNLMTVKLNVMQRWLFTYFGFLPWVLYFYIGALSFHVFFVSICQP